MRRRLDAIEQLIEDRERVAETRHAYAKVGAMLVAMSAATMGIELPDDRFDDALAACTTRTHRVTEVARKLAIWAARRGLTEKGNARCPMTP